jgi:hypothetical protein
MKRGIFLILIFLLLMDLADDGCFGKAQFVPPQSTAKASFSSFQNFNTGQINFSGKLPSLDLLAIFSLRQFQPQKPDNQLAFKLISICNNGSSGGIPL